MSLNEHIRYEPDEKTPLRITLAVALQAGVIGLSNAATLVTIFAAASGGSADYVAWALFASLIIGGIVTAIHATKLGRLSPGYILLMGPGSPFLAVCVLAVMEGGLPAMSNLIIAAAIVQFALAFWLAHLRRIITPVVAGVAFMVIAVSAMPIAVARLDDVPPGASPIAGPAVGAVALFLATILMLKASGLLRLLAFPRLSLPAASSPRPSVSTTSNTPSTPPGLAFPNSPRGPALANPSTRISSPSSSCSSS